MCCEPCSLGKGGSLPIACLAEALARVGDAQQLGGLRASNALTLEHVMHGKHAGRVDLHSPGVR